MEKTIHFVKIKSRESTILPEPRHERLELVSFENRFAAAPPSLSRAVFLEIFVQTFREKK